MLLPLLVAAPLPLAVVSKATASLPPVILVPGFAGSLLEAEVKRSTAANPLCALRGTQEVWFDKSNFLPVNLECWAEEMKLDLDLPSAATRGREVAVEPEGVHVHLKDFGNVRKGLFDYGAWHGGMGIWTPTINHLKKLGYAESQIFAAQYDWRHGPGYWMDHEWPRLKSFVEEKVSEAGGRPAIFIAVSMGSPYFVGFLHHTAGVDAAWKKRHVAAFVSMSGVFGGTIGALGLALWGDVRPIGATDASYQTKVDFLGRPLVKQLGRGWGGLASLIPKPAADKGLQPPASLLDMPEAFGRNVTDRMLADVLDHLSADLGVLYKLALRFPIDAHPGVKTLCLFGGGLPSPQRYVYLSTPLNDSSDDGNPAGGLLRETSKYLHGQKPNLMNVMGEVNELAQSVTGSSDRLQASEGGDDEAALAALADDAALNGDGWAVAAAELLRGRRPDLLQTTLGDGLVPHESLSVCERWRGEADLPDVEAYETEGLKHGADLLDTKSLRRVRATVAALAGVVDPKDDAVDEHPNGKVDMKRPLGEFEQYIGPELASWSCEQWVGSYGIVDGKHIGDAGAGCSASLVLKSPSCDERCKEAFTKDPSFLWARCPETCGGKPGAASKSRPARESDMERPLGEYAQSVGPEVAAWSCEQWAGIYGTIEGKSAAELGCLASFVMKSPSCDESCKEAFTNDPYFLRARCPETCSGKHVTASFERPNGKTDMKRPLGDFVQAVGPRVASWSCEQWAGLYGSIEKTTEVDRCLAGFIMKSPACDMFCHRAFTRDPSFLRTRCPETCSDSVSQEIVKAEDTMKRAEDLLSSPSWFARSPRYMLPILLVVVVASSSGVLLVSLSVCVVVWRKRASGGGAGDGDANAPLNEDGDFSEFEGHDEVSRTRAVWDAVFGAQETNARRLELQPVEVPIRGP